MPTYPPHSFRAWPRYRRVSRPLSFRFVLHCRLFPLANLPLAHLLLSFHSQRNPRRRRRRRRSSIAGIDLQMMTNAPFFRMKTALAKPTSTTDRDQPPPATRPPPRAPSPSREPATTRRMKSFPKRENCGVVGGDRAGMSNLMQQTDGR